MYLLSLDISLTKTGWAIHTLDADLVAYGVIEPKGKNTHRLSYLHTELQKVMEKYFPLHPIVVREGGIVRYNQATKQIFKAHGVVELVFKAYDIQDIPIQTIKAWARKAIGEKGNRMDKEIVKEAVKRVYPTHIFSFHKGGDDADAIAIGKIYLSSIQT